MSPALSPVLIRRRALGFLEDCKKKLDRGAVGGGGGGIEFVLGVELLCVTIPRVQASSLMLLALYCAHAGSDWFAEGERCFQPSLCLAEKVPLPLPFLGEPGLQARICPRAARNGSGQLGQDSPTSVAQQLQGLFLPFPCQVQQFQCRNSIQERACTSCRILPSASVPNVSCFSFLQKNLTTLRQQGELRWRLCKTCIPGLGKAVG